MKKIQVFNNKTTFDKILYAITSTIDYDMERTILIEEDEFNYIVVYGSHCSCYGFDETEWEAILYTKDELIILAKENSSFPDKMSIFILEYFGVK